MHNPTVPKNLLDRIILRGFKTIRELDFRPGPLTVLIGPNGAGKSNLISFFRLLSWALSDRDNLQPVQDLPDVLILDEPELGLHPYAINVIGGLIRAISTRIQAIVATQSAALVDCFEPQDTVVVERRGRASEFNRLDADELAVWLQSYSLSELWEKNVIGGRP